MITISLCMIVKDEEQVIARCLDTVKDLADEIIIVDTGSTDQTKEIATAYTAKIYDFTWVDDFAAARNYAFSKAGMEYTLWLDADDIVLPEDQEKLLKLKETLNPVVDVVNMHYVLAYDVYGNAIFSLRRNRLVRTSCHFQWHGAVHEYIEVSGVVQNSDIVITHRGGQGDADRNLRIYEKRLLKGEEFGVRDLYYYANELMEHNQLDKAIELYRQVLDIDEGWAEDKIAACARLADCLYKLGRLKDTRMALLTSFNYDSPRAEFCCRLGYLDLEAGKFQQAVFWYKLATELESPTEGWGPINHAFWTWLPHLQLCVCYDRLGQYDQAYHHNELARSFIPDDPRVLNNRQYLEGKLTEN